MDPSKQINYRKWSIKLPMRSIKKWTFNKECLLKCSVFYRERFLQEFFVNSKLFSLGACWGIGG